MATVRAYSVCQSEGGTAQRARSVYSYSPSVGLQDGSALTPDGTPAEDAYRTGLSPAYCHGGAATADADAVRSITSTVALLTLLGLCEARGLDPGL